MTTTMPIPALDHSRQDHPAPQTTRPPRGLVSQLLRDSAYLLLDWPVLLVGFTAVFTFLTVGLALTVIWVGLGLLAMGLFLSRGVGLWERALQAALLDRELPPRVDRPSLPAERGWSARIWHWLRDPQAWSEALFACVGWIVALAGWVLAVVWWAMVLGVTYWVWGRYIPEGQHHGMAWILGFGKGFRAEAISYTVLSALALVSLPFVMRGLAHFQSTMFANLLTSTTRLQRKVQDLEAGRDAARVAESTSFRRLERDMHDGPQQRLVRLQMDVARAQRALDRNPEHARELLSDLSRQTGDTLAELRALSRGIAPPVLVDRGLEAALTEITAGAPVPTRLDVHLDGSLPEHVETAAYFIVAECLTNIAKHSQASAALVRVVAQRRHTDEGIERWLAITVSDNGTGGATLATGPGLRGLEARVRSLAGVLHLDSPAGGPTAISAELPCGS